MNEQTGRLFSSLEVLESRIAPAAVLTYTDVDGDKVTIKVSKGDLEGKALLADIGLGQQLQVLDLTDAGFEGANLTVTVKKVRGGDGLVNLGHINATGINLGKVTIPGDVAQIDAGSGIEGAIAVDTINVRSVGLYGTSTQGVGGGLTWNIAGNIQSIKVKGSVKGATLDVQEAIGSINIGKSLIGGSTPFSGSIYAGGPIGLVTIGGDLQGGRGNESGVIQSREGGITSITIKGAFIGGSGDVAGMISAGLDLGPVKIGGDFMGGTGNFAGLIRSEAGPIGNLSVGGSIIGGVGANTGLISAQQSVGNIKIGGSLVGGPGNLSGTIKALDGLIGNVKIGGDLQGGGGSESGELFARMAMGNVTIAGSLIGGEGTFSGNLQSDSKIGNVTVKGSLMGGTNGRTGMIHGEAGLGKISIGRHVIGGSGDTSGSIFAPAGAIASLTIGRSLLGGTDNSTGLIFAGLDLGAVKVGRDIVGGNATAGNPVNKSGAIEAQNIASVSVGGSIIAGTNRDSSLGRSGSIQAAQSIGTITVKGGLIGNETHAVGITAAGEANPTASRDSAIGKITIGGDVIRARILGGVDLDYLYVNGDAQIGAMKVGGDWIASSIAAGIDPGLGGDFGNADDAVIPDGTLSRIASIQVNGRVVGSDTPGDHFGFVAKAIGSFKNGSIKLTAAIPVLELATESGDVTVRVV